MSGKIDKFDDIKDRIYIYELDEMTCRECRERL